MSNEVGELGGWAAAAVAILSLVLTWILRYRRDRREDREQQRKGDLEEESVAIDVQRQVIAQLTARVDALEQQILAMQKAREADYALHLECVRDKEQLRGELNVVKKELEALQRHEKRNVEHIESLQSDLAKIEAAKTDTGPMPIVNREQP